jgi:hypothetical protein
MIKLFSLKQQKKDGENPARPGTQQKKASAAQLRITKGEFGGRGSSFVLRTYHLEPWVV